MDSSKLLDSIVHSSARCFCSGEWILLLVSTFAYLFPIIYSDVWFFCTHLLGVFGCAWRSCCSFYASGFSCSSSNCSSTSYSLKSSLWSRSTKYFLLYFIFHPSVLSIVTLILCMLSFCLSTQRVYLYQLENQIFQFFHLIFWCSIWFWILWSALHLLVFLSIARREFCHCFFWELLYFECDQYALHVSRNIYQFGIH